MKHINPFDRMVQEQLANESEAAPMHLWDEIDIAITIQEEAKKEKKRRWLLIFLLLFTASAGTWLSYENYYSTETQRLSNVERQKPNASTDAFDSGLEADALTPPKTQNANSTTNTVSDFTASSETPSNVVINKKENKQYSTTNTQEDNKNLSVNEATNSVAHTPSLVIDQPQSMAPKKPQTVKANQLQQIEKETKENIRTTDIEAITLNKASALPAILNRGEAEKSTIDNWTILPLLTSNQSILNIKRTQEAIAASSEATVSELEKDNAITALLGENKSKTNHKRKAITKRKQSDYKALKRFFAIAPNPGSCYSFGGKNFDLRGIYVDAVVSSDLPFRTLATKDSEMETYRDIRDRSESYYWAGTGGLRLSVVTNSGLAFRTGLVYAQITERFKYENVDAERIVTETLIINGDTTVNTIIEQGRRYIEHSNHYNMFDIPLILGYEIESEKLVFNFNAGAYFNLLFKPKGRILSSDLHPVNINNTSMFRKNLGISYFGSMGFNYKFTRDLHLIIEPQIRYYPKSFTRDDYVISQKYFNFGFFTGLRFRL